MSNVYEVVDYTDEVRYWSLGIWLTAEAAFDALRVCAEPSDLGCDDHDDYDDVCRIEVWERNIGWGGMGTRVRIFKWMRKYNEAADEYEWEMTEKEA
jgi:hypothetical protein